MIDDIKKKLAEMTLDYANNHVGRNNAKQQQAKEELCIIMEAVRLLKPDRYYVEVGKEKGIGEILFQRKGVGHPFHCVK